MSGRTFLNFSTATCGNVLPLDNQKYRRLCREARWVSEAFVILVSPSPRLVNRLKVRRRSTVQDDLSQLPVSRANFPIRYATVFSITLHAPVPREIRKDFRKRMNLIPISTLENSTVIVPVKPGISEKAVDLELIENLCPRREGY